MASNNNRLNNERQSDLFKIRLNGMLKENEPGKGKKELQKHLGITQQALNQYTTGNGFPSMEKLLKMARFFDCSINYLAGTSNVRIPDINMEKICEYTGLSERAIEALHSLAESAIDEDKRPLHFLNTVLSDLVANASSDFPVSSVLSLADQYITAGEITRRLDVEDDYQDCKSADDFQARLEQNEYKRKIITLESSTDLSEVLTITELYKEYKMQLIKNELERYRKESKNEVQA